MPSTKPRFTLRADEETLQKIAHIATQHERSTTQEITYIIKDYIKKYEAEHGPIITDHSEL